jgi:hypothetical protein
VAAVVELVLSSAAADEEEETGDAISVDVAVLVAEATFGVVDARDAAAVLEA